LGLIRKYYMKYQWHKYNVAYRERRLVLDYSPREVWVEPTNFCNLRCVMCPQGKGLKTPRGHMDMALYTRIIDDLARLKVQRVNLFMGGESLLHKDAVGMISMARERKIPVRLHTNATLLTEELSDKILESGGLEEVSFSFDGEDKDRYERIRVNAKFDKTLKNILYFLEAKKRRGLKAPRTLIQVIKERTTDNAPPVVSEEFKAIFAGLGVDKFHPICFHNFGGTLDAKGDVKYEMARGAYKPCRHPWKGMSIAWDGEVVGCCVDMEKKLVLGDLKRQSVMEVWNGEPLQAFRKALAEERYREIELCKDCDHFFR